MSMPFSQRQFNCLLLTILGYDRTAISRILGITYGQTVYACEEARRGLIRLYRQEPSPAPPEPAPIEALLQGARQVPVLRNELDAISFSQLLRLLEKQYAALRDESLPFRQACCFTGHRPQNLPWGFEETDPRCVALKRELSRVIRYLIVKREVTHFLTGMALGVDTWAAELVLWYRGRYPERRVVLEAVLPCGDQTGKWRSADRERHKAILARCDLVNTLQERYSPGCMERRNRYMVDHAGYVVAVWNGRPSGTGETIGYAKRLGKTVIVLAP